MVCLSVVLDDWTTHRGTVAPLQVAPRRRQLTINCRYPVRLLFMIFFIANYSFKIYVRQIIHPRPEIRMAPPLRSAVFVMPDVLNNLDPVSSPLAAALGSRIPSPARLAKDNEQMLMRFLRTIGINSLFLPVSSNRQPSNELEFAFIIASVIYLVPYFYIPSFEGQCD